MASIIAPDASSVAVSADSADHRAADTGSSPRSDGIPLGYCSNASVTRLQELRAQGEVMDDDHAVACALDATAKAQAVAAF
jgi:hypothetical protein